MKNGDCVHICGVSTINNGPTNIPPEIIQDGPKCNISEYHQKFRFTRMKDVKIFFVPNSDGRELQDIRLDSLKEVNKIFFLLFIGAKCNIFLDNLKEVNELLVMIHNSLRERARPSIHPSIHPKMP